MEIRERIGKRIIKSRKALGITIKELSERTNKTLSAARISNWENGTRSPGPVEAKILSDQLNVSASYLLCLTDNPQGELTHVSGSGFRYIPVIALKDAAHYDDSVENDDGNVIVVDGYNHSIKGGKLFSTMVEDNSMQPDLNTGDIVIIDADKKPKPGDFVLANIENKDQIVIRKYGESNDCLFQLIASNDLWADLSINKEGEVNIVGVIVESRNYF